MRASIHTYTMHTSKSNGFILPLVLVVSLAALFILTPIVSRFVASLDITHASYQKRVAKEAARAGLAYATACYNESNAQQTWGPAAGKPNLNPSTDCSGTPISGKSQYIFNDGNSRMYFDVGNITSTGDTGIEISAQGYSDRLGATGSVAGTSSGQLKRVSWGEGVIGSGGGGGTDLQVDLGSWLGCALLNSGVYCWGSGDGLGVGGTPYSSSTPLKVLQEPGVMAGETITQISVGQSTVCAVSASGKLFCWGARIPWVGGVGGNSPVRITGALVGKNVTAVSVGDISACAIADGKIYCWGDDRYGLVDPNTGPYYFGLGTLGNGTGLHYDQYMLPSSVSTLTTPTLVTGTYLPANYQAVKLAHTGAITTQMCAILTTGQMYCWGGNSKSELGLNVGVYQSGGWWDTHYKYVSAPYPVYNNGYLDTKGVTKVATNGTTYNASNVSCAVSDGYPYCTRSGRYATYEPAFGKFERVTGSYTRPVFDIATGGQGQHTCALAQDGLYCWSAQYRPGSPWYNASNNAPVHIPTLGGQSTTNLISVAAYWNDVCGLFADSHLYCWNGFGQSGSGTLNNVTEIDQVYKLVHGFYF